MTELIGPETLGWSEAMLNTALRLMSDPRCAADAATEAARAALEAARCSLRAADQCSAADRVDQLHAAVGAARAAVVAAELALIQENDTRRLNGP